MFERKGIKFAAVFFIKVDLKWRWVPTVWFIFL